RARFRTEAQAIARLSHANVVQIHEVGEHDGLPYFAMEFCPGGGLDKRLNGAPLPPREAAELVRALALAVDAAHGSGVVHRDLKPANVLLSSPSPPNPLSHQGERGSKNSPPSPLVGEGGRGGEGERTPKITDFGLAKKLDEQGQTLPGAVLGTP